MTSKERLEQYIKEDEVYNDWLDENTSYVSDFDRFCIQHCEDIKCLLEENEKLKQWDNNKDSRNSRQRVANAKLLKENQKLRKKLDEYENPEDMTLMMMWCTEKVKDKIKELNQKYVNAVADYESTMFEKEQLKKQLEEYKEQVNKGLYNTCLPYTTGYNKAIKDKETQQKEFIKWLEDKTNICDGFLATVKSDLQEIPYGAISVNKTYITTQIKENEIAHKVYEEILQKYKKITQTE